MPAIPDNRSVTTSRQPRFFAIVPAAGRSVRMGEPKLLLPWGERTLIEHVLGEWMASRASHVVVVVHPADAELAATCRRAGVDVLSPTVPPGEMKISVAHGLALVASRYTPDARDAWLLAPADVPGLSQALIDSVIARHDPALPRIIVATCGGRHAHPALFPWNLAEEVPKLSADQGLNALVKRHPPLEVSWSDDSALADIDSPEDYLRFRGAQRPAPEKPGP